MLHPNLGLHILYNYVSFHSVLCFPNDYDMVKVEKWNINDLKNINNNKVNDLFFLSASKVVLDLVVQGYLSRGYMSRGYMS